MGKDDILEESIRYVVAASEGLMNMYPERLDMNMKRAVRKIADRVIVKRVDVIYKTKGKEEVFAVSLAHGQDPATLIFDWGKMRAMCLDQREWIPLKELKFKKKLPLLNF